MSASLTMRLSHSHLSHPRSPAGETHGRSGKALRFFNSYDRKGSLLGGGCPEDSSYGRGDSALLNVRGERAPCMSGEAEYCVGAVLGVAHGDYISDVSDFDAVTAVGVAVAGPAPAAASCCAHLSVTSAIRSSDRERESASSRRSSNICAA